MKDNFQNSTFWFVPGGENGLADALFLSRLGHTQKNWSVMTVSSLKQEKKAITQKIHSNGHWGMKKTKEALENAGHKMPHKLIVQTIQECPICQQFRTPKRIDP